VREVKNNAVLMKLGVGRWVYAVLSAHVHRHLDMYEAENADEYRRRRVECNIT